MDNGATKIVKLNTLLNAIDSLETANKSLERKNPLKWKWFAFSIHHSLYQFCCKALHNGNYKNLVSSNYQIDEGYLLKKGDSKHWLKSRKKKIRDGHPAYLIEWEETDDKPPKEMSSKIKNNNKRKNLLVFGAP